MRVAIPFQYRASYVCRGRRTPERVHLPGEALIDIREVPTEDATIAFLVADSSGITPELSPLEGKPRRIIRHDERYWRDLGSEERFRSITCSRPDPLPGKVMPMHDHPFAPRKIEIETSDYNGVLHNEIHWDPVIYWRSRADVEREFIVRKWTDDGGNASMVAIRNAARNLIVVGGHVFQATEEPCWCVRKDRMEIIVGITVTGTESEAIRRNKFGNLVQSQNNRFDDLFNISRRSDAVNFATQKAEELGIPHVRVEGRAKVAPGLFPTFADDLLALDRAAWAVRKNCQNNLPGISREAGMAWVELRDALDESGDITTTRVATAIMSIATAWSGVDNTRLIMGGYGNSYLDGFSTDISSTAFMGRGNAWTNTSLDHCIDASARWKNRPRGDGREWLDSCTGVPSELAGTTVHEAVSLDALAMSGLELGWDLIKFGADVAAGEGRILLATAGEKLVGAAFVEPDGVVRTVFGRAGKGAPTQAVEAFEDYLSISQSPAP